VCSLNILVDVRAALGERNDVIDMERVATHSQPANTAEAERLLVDDLWVDRLVIYTSDTRATIRSFPSAVRAHPFKVLRVVVRVGLAPAAVAFSPGITKRLPISALDNLRLFAVRMVRGAGASAFAVQASRSKLSGAVRPEGRARKSTVALCALATVEHARLGRDLHGFSF
jgi:hypothetical protein